MSMDLNFWKYKEDTAHDHSTVYQTACCDGEVMEVLEVLPIDEILKKWLILFLTGIYKVDAKILKKKDMEHFRFLQLRKS